MKSNVILKSFIVILVVSLAGFLSSCSSGSTGSGSEGNKIKIMSISPDINTPLQVGNSYEISVDVEYSLKQDNGSITLVLQRGDAVPTVSSSLGNVTEPIKKGSGRLTLKAKISVPNTNSIVVFTPLSVSGESQSTTVDMRVFKVVGN